MKSRLPYQEIRDLVKEHRGTMIFQREGYQWGAWIVRVGNKKKAFLSNGSGYPEIDHLYKVKLGVTNPSHWSDYSLDLVESAWEKFIRLLAEA